MEITLYRSDLKAPQDGVEQGYTFFDGVLENLGVPEDEREDLDEITLVISEVKRDAY